MPAMDREWSRRDCLRESLMRSVAMAIGLLLHLALLLVMLRPPLPWSMRRPAAAAPGTIRLELLPRPKHPVISLPKPHPSIALLRHASRMPAMQKADNAPPTSPALSRPNIIEPLATPAADYGNSRFAQALDAASSSGIPPLPGAYAISRVPGIVVAPPPSLKTLLHALGRWHYCKDAIFKRHMTDEEILKRGLTRRQMDQAFQAYCVP